MKPTALIGRESELKTLEEMRLRHDAALILVYGRRRVGKTRLLQEWAKRPGLATFYR